MKTVGVTSKISKWLLEKQAPKVLGSFLFTSVTQTQKHRWTSMGTWEVSLHISRLSFARKTVKVNQCAN